MRISHIGICVSDWKRSLQFYHDVLGFRFVSELEVKGPLAERLLRLEAVELRAAYLEREGVRIELLHYASPGCVGDGSPRAMNALGFTHLSMRVEDMDATLSAMRERGVDVLEETTIDNPELGARAVFVTDPDGTLIELVQARGD